MITDTSLWNWRKTVYGFLQYDYLFAKLHFVIRFVGTNVYYMYEYFNVHEKRNKNTKPN